LLDHGASLLNPGGRLSLVDFGQQERLPGAFRTLLFAWLAKFDVTPRADLPTAVEAAALRRNMAPYWQPKLRGYAWSVRIERI
jgi:S-adenosylmethionine-diacylgycerolhomoserine-N-methlytransferase